MKTQLVDCLNRALQALINGGVLTDEPMPDVQVERCRDPDHGDFACNVAMVLGRKAGIKPRELAQRIIDALPNNEWIEKIEVAGPGFINFKLKSGAFQFVVTEILKSGGGYGRTDTGKGARIQIEFVSANPTGPLHVGHGRGAAYGSALANLLMAVGYEVQREYYVNDAGRQIDILGASVFFRYLELCGEELDFPDNAYQGDYIWDIAATLHHEHGEAFRHPPTRLHQFLEKAPDDDQEARMDALILCIRDLLGNKHYHLIVSLALELILKNIRSDLAEFGIEYDNWFSERSLADEGAIDRVIKQLKDHGDLYEHDGALWFRSSRYGDKKDRVVIRENGQKTYFASDIAYHAGKLERGYDRIIDVWGADHHGYAPRLKAAIQALGDDPDTLDVLLVQFAILYREGKKLQMSTRSGEYVTLRELRQEVGNDAARFFYVLRRCEQHLDFDLDLAKSNTNENPVYYIQYAHARICSVMRHLEEKGLHRDEALGNDHLHRLVESHEQALLATLSRFTDVIEKAAKDYEPHTLAHFLRDLANDFHTYYNAHQFLVDKPELRNARVNLILATRQVIRNGLKILGVSAPEEM